MKYLVLHETASTYKFLGHGIGDNVIEAFNAQCLVSASMEHPPKAQKIFPLGCFVECDAEMIRIDVTQIDL